MLKNTGLVLVFAASIAFLAILAHAAGLPAVPGDLALHTDIIFRLLPTAFYCGMAALFIDAMGAN